MLRPKRLLCGVAGGALALTSAGLLMAGPAFASYTSDCSTFNGQAVHQTVGDVTVYEGTGRTGSADTTAVGACVQNNDGAHPGATAPVGGDGEVGVSLNHGEYYNPLAAGCPSPSATPLFPGCMAPLPAAASPGVYAVADGSNTNPQPAGVSQGVGYLGVSNYETGSANDGQGNTGCASGNCGSNSGGADGIKGVAAVPGPIVCGDTSGPSWDTSARDGCFIP
jgi:hypothetical protein